MIELLNELGLWWSAWFAGMQQEPVAYSKSLLSISELLVLPGREALTTACFSESFHAVKRRINYQLQQQEGKTMRLSLWQKVATLAIMVMIFLFASLQCSKEIPEKTVGDQPAIVEDKIYVEDEVDKAATPKIESVRLFNRILDLTNEDAYKIDIRFQVVVKKDGTVDQIEMINSIPGLEKKIEENLKKLQYEPAIKNGQPVAYKGTFSLRYDSLHGLTEKTMVGIPISSNRERLDLITKYEKGSDDIFEFFAVSTKPTVLKTTTPKYPVEAREAGIEGRVVVTVTIDQEGFVENAEIFTSADSLLNDAALEAAKRFIFTPAFQRDKRIRVKMNLPFNFTLKK
jgi:TonB family protein